MDKIFKIGLFIAAVAAYMPSFGMIKAIQIRQENGWNDRSVKPVLNNWNDKVKTAWALTCEQKDKNKEFMMCDGFVKPRPSRESVLAESPFGKIPVGDLLDIIDGSLEQKDIDNFGTTCRQFRQKYSLAVRDYCDGKKFWITFDPQREFKRQYLAKVVNGITFTKDELIACGDYKDELIAYGGYAEEDFVGNSIKKLRVDSWLATRILWERVQCLQKNVERDNAVCLEAFRFAAFMNEPKSLALLLQNNKEHIEKKYPSKDSRYELNSEWVQEAVKYDSKEIVAFLLEENPLGLNNHSDISSFNENIELMPLGQKSEHCRLEGGPIRYDIEQACIKYKKSENDRLFYDKICEKNGCNHRLYLELSDDEDSIQDAEKQPSCAIF